TSCLAIPTRVRKTQLRSNPKWFNQSIKALTREKYKFHCLCRSAPHNADLKAAYIQSCKKVKTAVRKAICKFEAFIVRSCKLQPKLLFNYINSQKACNDSIKGLLDADGYFQTDGRVIVRLLNEHFSSVFSLRDYESVPAMPCRSNTKCVVNLDVFSPDSVYLIILPEIFSGKTKPISQMELILLKFMQKIWLEIKTKLKTEL
ncbi:MAG: hypothetical protein R6U26_02055, partial [Candidatus Undinarchaeales archaeon]